MAKEKTYLFKLRIYPFLVKIKKKFFFKWMTCVLNLQLFFEATRTDLNMSN